MSDRPPDSAFASAFLASPNHGARRGYARANCVILHYTGMPRGDQALNWLCDPTSEVSAHYFVRESGDTIQLVGEDRRAWHAGAGSWKGETDVNSASIGIEIVNPGHDGELPPYPDPQIEAVIALVSDICARLDIAQERVLAHSDVAPGRKRDPGEHFPWERLARAGVGHWTEPPPPLDDPLFAHGEEGPSVRALQAMLALYGYGVELTGVLDQQTRNVLAAFQRHFRPVRVDGEADSSTIETLRALIVRLSP